MKTSRALIVTMFVGISGIANAASLPFYTCDKTSVSFGQTLHARTYAQGLSDSSSIPVAWVNLQNPTTIVLETSAVNGEIKVRLSGYDRLQMQPVISGAAAKMGEEVSLVLADDNQSSIHCFATALH